MSDSGNVTCDRKRGAKRIKVIERGRSCGDGSRVADGGINIYD